MTHSDGHTDSYRKRVLDFFKDHRPPADLTICPLSRASAAGFSKMTHNSSDYSQFLLVKPKPKMLLRQEILQMLKGFLKKR